MDHLDDMGLTFDTTTGCKPYLLEARESRDRITVIFYKLIMVR